MLIAAVAMVNRRISGLSHACRITEFHIVGENPLDNSTAVTSRKWQRYWSSASSWNVIPGGMEKAKCEAVGFEESRAKCAPREGEASDGDSVAAALETSLRFIVGVTSLGCVSSFEAYPAHLRPKFAHRRQFGFVSSHLTRRALFIPCVSKVDHSDKSCSINLNEELQSIVLVSAILFASSLRAVGQVTEGGSGV
jgi:hypothetical protein